MAKMGDILILSLSKDADRMLRQARHEESALIAAAVR
jgi:hypothetical protein